MKIRTLVVFVSSTLLCAAALPVLAQEHEQQKVVILPANYKQTVLEAQEKSAKIHKEAGRWMEEGSQCAKTGKYIEAIDAYNKADEILVQNKFTPDHYCVTAEKAQIFAKMGQAEAAIKAYRSVFYRQLEKGEGGDTLILSEHSLMEFALLLHQSGQDEEARLIYEKGLPLVNQRAGAYGPTLDDHFTTTNSNPKRFLAAVYVGLALTVRQDFSLPAREEGKADPATEAEYNYYQQALKQYPTFALAHYYLAGVTNARNAELGRTGPAVWQETKDEYKKAAQYGRGRVKAEAEKHFK